MKVLTMYCMLFLIVFSSQSSGDSQYTGTFTQKTSSGVITLTLRQEISGQVTGTFSDPGGEQYAVAGDIEEGDLFGTCTGNSGKLFFEAFLEEGKLFFGIMGADHDNMPDYDDMKEFVLTRDGIPVQNVITRQSETELQIPATPAYSSPLPDNSIRTGSPEISSGETGDKNWGFKFPTPAGWISRKTPEGAILGHNSIAGMIIILPHTSSGIDEVRQQMLKGLSEGDNSLALTGGLKSAGNFLSGDYVGYYEGAAVKAKGFGTYSPFGGGGAYIICLSGPDKITPQLTGAGERIAGSIKYFKVDASDLMRHFAGSWSYSSGNRSDTIVLYPDGRYSNTYEASYTGRFTDGAGTELGNWGNAGGSSGKGRWTVRGNKDSGSIIVTESNGNKTVYEYRVHVENGTKYYHNYRFNGKFYIRSRE